MKRKWRKRARTSRARNAVKRTSLTREERGITGKEREARRRRAGYGQGADEKESGWMEQISRRRRVEMC
jgi:hypothetical protein